MTEKTNHRPAAEGIAPGEEQINRPRKKKKRRSSRAWRRFIVIYTLVFLIIGAAGCAVLYKFLDCYEQSRPKYIMDEILASTSEEEWLSTMRSTAELSFSKFEDTNEIINGYYEASCRGKTINYSEAVSVSTPNAPVYNIKAGSASMCRVYLKPDKALGFGFSTWQLDRIEAYIPQGSLASATIHVETPEGTAIFVNGIELDESYIVDGAVPVENLTALEQRYEQQPVRILYEVSGLYGTIRVTDANGKELAPAAETDSTGAVVYSVASPTYSFKVTAPAEAKVYCNGVQLTDAEITEHSAGLLAGFEEYANNSDAASVMYSVDGLYFEPAITAEDPNNRTMERGDGTNGEVVYQYAGDESLADELQPVADQFFNYYINYGAGYDAYYQLLLNCILPGTDLYTYVKDSTAAMYWASDTKVEFEYLDYTRFVQWSDDCFTCRVSYKANMAAKAWYESYEYDLENTYDLVFVRQNGNWFAASMSAAE